MNPMLGLIGVIVAAIAAEFNDQVTSTALPDISGALALGHDPGTWFDTLYITAETIGMAISPWLLVTFSLRQFTLFVLLLNVVSSVLIPAAPELGALYVLRSAQGLSDGLTIPLLMTTALRVLDPPIRLYGLAIYSLTASFTPALATTMAALWTSAVGWRFIFLVAAPLCTLAALLVWYGMPQDPPQYDRIRRFDWRGFLLAALGFGSLSIMLQQGDRLDWFNSPFICMLALTSTVALPLFVLNEWYHPLPLMRPQLLGRRNLAYGGIALLTFLIISLSGSILPNQFLQEVQGYRPEQAYQVTALVAAAQLVLLPATAWLLDFPQVEARVLHLLGLCLVMAACLGSSLVTTDWFRGQFYAWQVLQAIGQPLIIMSLLMMSTNSVKKADEAPYAAALINTPRAVAEAAGIWLIQLVQRWRGSLHYNRLADQAGQDRFRLIQAQALPPLDNPPLMPNGQPASPHSLAQFAEALQAQARVLTISDMYLVLAGVTMLLMIILVVLSEPTLPPRIQLAKK